MAYVRLVEKRSTFLTRFTGNRIQQAPVCSLVNPYNLYAILNLENRNFIQWLQSNGLLAKKFDCERCKSEMKFQKRSNRIDGFCWKCNKKNCGSERSIRKWSFFEGSQYPLQDIFSFMVHFALGENLVRLSMITGMDYKTTCIDWANFCRDVCRQYIHEEMPHKVLKGIIEVDESLFGRRVKFNRGNANVGIKVWIVGLVERETDQLLLFPVDNREATTLEKIINDHVEKGATVYTDGWAGYSRLNKLGYKHFVVNHKHAYAVDYLDEATGQTVRVHTNTIEGAWKHAKDHFKRINGTSLGNFEAHLAEVQWRNWIKKWNAIEHFLTYLVGCYPTFYPPMLNALTPLFPYWQGGNAGIASESVLPQDPYDEVYGLENVDYEGLSKSWLTPDNSSENEPVASSSRSDSTDRSKELAKSTSAGTKGKGKGKRKPGLLPDPVPMKHKTKALSFKETSTPASKESEEMAPVHSTPRFGAKPRNPNFSLGSLFSDYDHDDDDADGNGHSADSSLAAPPVRRGRPAPPSAAAGAPPPPGATATNYDDAEDGDDFMPQSQNLRVPIMQGRPARKKSVKPAATVLKKPKKPAHGKCPKGFRPKFQKKTLSEEQKAMLSKEPEISEDEELETSMVNMNY